jgi:hypothetical protein
MTRPPSLSAHATPLMRGPRVLSATSFPAASTM